MTNALTCELFTDSLMPYLEREVDDATATAMERHAAACGECGALLADLRRLRADAANLPSLQPSRDLWAGIAARIEAPVLDIGTARPVATVAQAPSRRWLRVSLAAAALVAAAGMGYVAAISRVAVAPATIAGVPSDSGAAVAVVPEGATAPITAPDPFAGNREAARATNPARAAAAPAAQPTEVQVALASLTADYDREVARLRTLIEQRRNQLDPVTVAVIEKNLQVIDSAIEDCKKAIARDPASRFLIESLNESLRSKVELMRTAALLPSRT